MGKSVEDFDWLRNICFSVVRMRAQALTPLWLRAFKGSTFRGAFGAALKGLACLRRGASCQACPLSRACPYVALFEPPNTLPWLSTPDAPTPFVLEPPGPPVELIPQGEEFSVGLVLIGPGITYLPHFILAWREMGLRLGVGKGRDRGLGRFLLTSVHDAGQVGEPPLFDEKARAVLDSPRVWTAHEYAYAACGSTGDLKGIAVTLSTPLRVQSGGHLLTPSGEHALTPKHLMEAIYRRLYILAATYGEQPLPPLRMPSFADERPISQNLRWQEWARYSNRQQAHMKLGGVVGEMVLPPSYTRYLPLLRAAEVMHVGKATTFGFGAVHCMLLPAAPSLSPRRNS